MIEIYTTASLEVRGACCLSCCLPHVNGLRCVMDRAFNTTPGQGMQEQTAKRVYSCAFWPTKMALQTLLEWLCVPCAVRPIF